MILFSSLLALNLSQALLPSEGWDGSPHLLPPASPPRHCDRPAEAVVTPGHTQGQLARPGSAREEAPTPVRARPGRPTPPPPPPPRGSAVRGATHALPKTSRRPNAQGRSRKSCLSKKENGASPEFRTGLVVSKSGGPVHSAGLENTNL